MPFLLVRESTAKQKPKHNNLNILLLHIRCNKKNRHHSHTEIVCLLSPIFQLNALTLAYRHTQKKRVRLVTMSCHNLIALIFKLQSSKQVNSSSLRHHIQLQDLTQCRCNRRLVSCSGHMTNICVESPRESIKSHSQHSRAVRRTSPSQIAPNNSRNSTNN